MFNGTLVNVEKLMERIKTAEKSLLDTEQVLADVKRQNVELTAANSKATTKMKDLQADLKSATRKLGDSELSSSSLQRKNADYLAVLNSIQDKITPVLVKRERSSSSRHSDKEVQRSSEVKQAKGATATDETSQTTTTTATVKKEK